MIYDNITVDIDLPDTIIDRLTKEADERLLSVDELIEVILVDYIEGNL